jgi:uncharacterized protein (TIGR04255 family)
MARVYKNPPLIQAICEYSFEPTQTWDWTVPGLFYTEVKNDFPKKREQNLLQVELQTGANVMPPAIKGGIASVQFLTEDEKTLIQVGPDLVAAHRLRPYTGWENFKPTILRAVEAYTKVAKPSGIRRLGLRFINRIEITGKTEVRIEDYLLAAPKVPDEIPQTFGSWGQRVEIPLTQAGGALILQSGSVPADDGKAVAFMLDLVFVTTINKPLPLGEAERRLEIAHTEVERAFETCITDEARKLFSEADS